MIPPPTTNRGRIALKFFAALCACLSLPLLLVGQVPMVPSVALSWDCANVLGYLSLVAFLLLFVYAGRPRAFPPFSGRFFANLHRDLGYIALLLAAAHVGLLLVTEPLLLEHLKPTAPAYMLAGLVGLVLLLLLVVPSITGLRKRIWADYRRFKRLHGWLAIACALLLGWHVVESRFYLNTNWKLAVLIVSALVVLGYYLYGRPRGNTCLRRGPRLRDTAHFSHLISYGSAVLLMVVALSVVWLRLPE